MRGGAGFRVPGGGSPARAVVTRSGRFGRVTGVLLPLNGPARKRGRPRMPICGRAPARAENRTTLLKARRPQGVPAVEGGEPPRLLNRGGASSPQIDRITPNGVAGTAARKDTVT